MIPGDFRVETWSSGAGDVEESGAALVHAPCGRTVATADGETLANLVVAAEGHACPEGLRTR